MSKAVLGSLVAEKHGLTKGEADKIVETMLEGIKSALVSQGQITFVGFGRFHVEERAARQGRNPSTGEAVQVAASKVVRFKAGEPLKAAVNQK